MLKNKKFYDADELTDYVNKYNLNVVSITRNGEDFFDSKLYVLFYTEQENKNMKSNND